MRRWDAWLRQALSLFDKKRGYWLLKRLVIKVRHDLNLALSHALETTILNLPWRIGLMSELRKLGSSAEQRRLDCFSFTIFGL